MRFRDNYNSPSFKNIHFKGGGGGGSGKIDYPQYMKDSHAQLMFGNTSGNPGDMSIAYPMDTAVNDAISGNPYTSLVPYDPTPHVTEMANALDDLDIYINSMNSTEEIETQLAKFDAGMRDINAVVSSAYVVGRTIIAGGLLATKLQAKADLAKLSVETRRIMIIANKEFTDEDNEYTIKDAKWSLEVLQKGGNVLGSIAGSSTITQEDEKNRAASALAGGLTGAAAGAYMGSKVGWIGGPWGAVAGGVIGAAAGYFL